MNHTTQRLLKRLGDLGFAVRPDGFAPFGEELPLVTGVAWDAQTAQLALIAEMVPEDSDAAWRQLLFAASGLRHQLAGDGPSAFGTPIVLAVVDDAGVRRLRRLTEDLSERYALFNRVDLNLVRIAETKDDEQLDLALAPLLPSCRTLLGTEISRADVQRFWQNLREEIQKAAVSSLESLFAPYIGVAAQEAADVLIGDSAEAPELPAPGPINSVTLRDFRSFAEQDIELHPATVIHGPNGGGKTTVIEALELSWAGRSQRQPSGVEAAEYARHLDRDGGDHFTVLSDGVARAELTERPSAELPRSVLGQDALGILVSATPAERYAALLTTSGLEIPELEIRTERLLRSAKQEADAALVAAGLPPLPRIDSLALKHLRKGLAGGFAGRIPSAGEIAALERMTDEASGGGFDARQWERHPPREGARTCRRGDRHRPHPGCRRRRDRRGVGRRQQHSA